MRWGGDYTFAEDGRRANPRTKPQETATGDLYWALEVKVYASPRWPLDITSWMFIRERKSDGVLVLETGRYCPQSAQGDGDDGA